MSDLDAVARKLETEGVDVDELRTIATDPSLMYWYQPDRHTKDIATVALTAAAVPSLIPNLLAATAITREDGEETQCGIFRVERSDLDAYNADRITKKEYVQRVADTWENPWGDA